MVILFDLDDTLLDHTTAVRAAASALHRGLGLSVGIEDFLAAWSESHARHYPRFLSEGVPYEEIRRVRVREVIDPQLSDQAADAVFATYYSSYESNWVLFKDVLGCLERLSGRRLGIVSNGPGHEQRRKLVRLGISDLFEGIFISEECGSAKPDPSIFLGACRAFAEPPSRVMYVGDRYDLDAVAARTAGLCGVWLDRSGAADRDHEGPIICSLDELVALVEHVEALPNQGVAADGLLPPFGRSEGRC
jgi:putative hydrolase of the HAD superfamily